MLQPQYKNDLANFAKDSTPVSEWTSAISPDLAGDLHCDVGFHVNT